MIISGQLTPRHLASLSFTTMAIESALRRSVPARALHAVLSAVGISYQRADAATLASINRCSERTPPPALTKFTIAVSCGVACLGKGLRGEPLADAA